MIHERIRRKISTQCVEDFEMYPLGGSKFPGPEKTKGEVEWLFLSGKLWRTFL